MISINLYFTLDLFIPLIIYPTKYPVGVYSKVLKLFSTKIVICYENVLAAD